MKNSLKEELLEQIERGNVQKMWDAWKHKSENIHKVAMLAHLIDRLTWYSNMCSKTCKRIQLDVEKATNGMELDIVERGVPKETPLIGSMLSSILEDLRSEFKNSLPYVAGLLAKFDVDFMENRGNVFAAEGQKMMQPLLATGTSLLKKLASINKNDSPDWNLGLPPVSTLAAWFKISSPKQNSSEMPPELFWKKFDRENVEAQFWGNFDVFESVWQIPRLYNALQNATVCKQLEEAGGGDDRRAMLQMLQMLMSIMVIDLAEFVLMLNQFKAMMLVDIDIGTALQNKLLAGSVSCFLAFLGIMMRTAPAQSMLQGNFTGI